MVYIERDTIEPVVSHRRISAAPHTVHAHEHSPLLRWCAIGCAAAVVVYSGLLIIGWQAVSLFFDSLSL